MKRTRTWMLVGTGTAVAALGVTGLTALGAAGASASRHGAALHARRAHPADQGLGGPNGAVLTIGSGGTTGGTASTGGTSSSGITLGVSSYDFVVSLAGTVATQSGGTGAGKVAAGTLVVTTSLAAQGDLTTLTAPSTATLTTGGGPAGLDVTFQSLALRQYEVSSENGGTVTLTFGFLSANPTQPTGTPPPPGGSWKRVHNPSASQHADRAIRA